MRNHPANRDRQVQAVVDAGHDPQVGTWPGDPGFEGDGSVSGAGLCELQEHSLTRSEETLLLLLLHADDAHITEALIGLAARSLVCVEGRLTKKGRTVAKTLNFKRMYGG